MTWIVLEVREIENRQEVIPGLRQHEIRLRWKISIDSPAGSLLLFGENFLRGGDPGESAALFHTFEILKHRRPGSLGKALDSEAGQGWG